MNNKIPNNFLTDEDVIYTLKKAGYMTALRLVTRCTDKRVKEAKKYVDKLSREIEPGQANR